MNKTGKIRLSLAAILAASIILSGCGSVSTTSVSESVATKSAATSSSFDSSSISGTTSVSSVSSSSDYEDSYYDDSSYETESISEGTESSASSEKLVYICDLEIESTEYDEAVSFIREIIDEYDAIVESESESNSNTYWYYESTGYLDYRTLEMTVRVPAESYEDFLDELSGESDSLKIMYRESYVENITQEYASNETTIKALETELERLLNMMDSAETISDMITVEERITEVETQLNDAESLKNTYDSLVSYSTVYIELDEVHSYSYSVNELSYGERLINAIKGSWGNFVEFLGDALIEIIYLLPFIVIAIIIFFIARKILKRRKKNVKADGNGS